MKKSVYQPVEKLNPSDFPLLFRIFYCQVDNPYFQIANVVVAIVLFCAMAPRFFFRYKYRHDSGIAEIHHLLLQAYVLGLTGCGKSFSRFLYRLICEPLIERDRISEHEELQYAELKRTCRKTKDLPPEPVTVRLCLNKVTANKIKKRAHMMVRKYGSPLTFMIFADELSTLIERRGSWGDLRDISKLAYDWNSETATDTAFDGSYNCSVDINWCSVINTTASVANKYFDPQSTESGGANRAIILQLGDMLGEKGPLFKALSDKDLETIHEWQDRLMKATYTDNDQLQPEHEIPMDWLWPDIEAWCDAQDAIIAKTCSKSHFAFFHRASTSAARIAAMCYYAWGENPKKRKQVRRIYFYFADLILQTNLKMFGRRFEKYAGEADEDSLDPDDSSKAPLYDQMGERFTRDALKAKVEELKLGTKARQFIHKWLSKHLIYEESENVYVKNYK